MEKWGLRDPEARQLLGGMSTGSFYALKKEPKGRTLDQDTLTRVSLLIGIFKALNILYSPKLADAWMTLPNTNPIFRESHARCLHHSARPARHGQRAAIARCPPWRTINSNPCLFPRPPHPHPHHID